MKKRKHSADWLKTVVILLCWAARALAQDSTDESSPPLVPAPEQVEPTPPPATSPTGVLVPKQIANKPLEPEATETGLVNPRGKRLLFSSLLGIAAGGVGGTIGALSMGRLGAGLAPPLGGTWAGASVGWLVGAPLGVLLGGALFDGDGAWWATVLGDVIGGVVGAATLFLSGGLEALPVFALLSLGGSLIGYEATSHDARLPPSPGN